MIHRDSEGNIQLRTGELNHFLGVVEYQKRLFDEYQKAEQDKEPRENEDLEERIVRSLRQHDYAVFPPYISTIFTALFLEAFIYDYSARKGSQAIAGMLDKLDPPSKWVIATKLLNEKGIEPSNNCYSMLKKVFKLRNALAHNKSKPYDIDSMEIPQSAELIEPDECLDIIKSVLQELVKIDADEEYSRILIYRISNPMY